MIEIFIKVFAVVVGVIAFAGPAAAQIPAALVEDVRGKVTGAEFMDYVAPGKVIKIGPAGMVVLSYMKSCRREAITGAGTVIVGTEESMVQQSEVDAAKVRCDSGHSLAVEQEVADGAATSFRSLDPVSSRSPRLTVYGLSPLFEAAGRGKLTVERLDLKGERYEIDLAGSSLVRHKFYDFAKAGTSLMPGGIYAASLGSQRVVFSVDRRAEPGATPIIGRLVRLQ